MPLLSQLSFRSCKNIHPDQELKSQENFISYLFVGKIRKEENIGVDGWCVV